MNLNRESRMRSVKQEQELGQNLSVCMGAGRKQETFET